MEVKVGPMGATHWDQMIIEAAELEMSRKKVINFEK